MQCDKCLWSKVIPDDKEHLECHRERHQLIVQETQLSQPKPILIWPQVKLDDFCKLFEDEALVVQKISTKMHECHHKYIKHPTLKDSKLCSKCGYIFG